MKNIIAGINRKIKKFIEKFFLINDTPHKIAAGAALGVFLGIIPGEGVISALIFASLLRINRLSATTGVLATNWWTTLVVLPLAATLGGFLFHEDSYRMVEDFKQTFKLGYKYFFTKAVLFDIAMPLIVGYLIVAGAIAIACYFSLWLLLKNKKIKFK